MPKKYDLIGMQFDYLKVIGKEESNKVVGLWICECVCGKTKKERTTRLVNGTSKSCGCKRPDMISKANKKHGMSKKPIYNVWMSMKQRCDNPKTTYAKYYHEKGIGYCEKWKEFQGFYEDMGEDYKHGLFIDRIDNSKGYSKENCRWVTPLVSNQNKTSVKNIKTAQQEV